MIFPFDSLVSEHREAGLLMAVLLGFGFGFVLERAGFGRATKLAAQFYFYDMTVFKVMFGAIVTAMLGLVIFSQLGWVELKSLADAASSSTFLIPMVVGGFVLGLGFIIGGYCPGTSIVAAASGNLDGLIAFAGVIVGTWIYSEIYPWISHFHNSNDLGHIYLYEILHLPAPLVAFLVTAMALGCFFGAEKLEAVFKKKLNISSSYDVPMEKINTPQNRKFAFTLLGSSAVLGIILLALPKTTVDANWKTQEISSEQLAMKILEKPWSIRILDLRKKESCASQRIPGAECTPIETLKALNLFEDTSRVDLVLVLDESQEQRSKSITTAIRGYAGKVLFLNNGFEGWKQYALQPPTHPGTFADAHAIASYQVRSAIHTMVTGSKQAPPPAPRTIPAGSGESRKKGSGCSS